MTDDVEEIEKIQENLYRHIADRHSVSRKETGNSGYASAEIENDIEAETVETQGYGTRSIDLLMAYYNDPDNDLPDAGKFPKLDLSRADRHNESAVICYVVAVVILLALAALWVALAWVGLSRCGAGLCL